MVCLCGFLVGENLVLKKHQGFEKKKWVMVGQKDVTQHPGPVVLSFIFCIGLVTSVGTTVDDMDCNN